MSLLSDQYKRLREKCKDTDPSLFKLSVWPDRYSSGYRASVAVGGGVMGEGKTPEDALKNAVTHFISLRN